MRFVEGPLIRELQAIAKGERQLPASAAKRHHFVPAFLLANFATPRQRKGFMHQLDTSTGRPQRTTPDSTAFVPGLYAVGEDGDELVVESILSIVEKHSAGSIRRLVEDPSRHQSHEDRQTLCYLLALQFMRTPVAIDRMSANAGATFELQTRIEAGNPRRFLELYRERDDPNASVEKAEEARQKLLRSLDEVTIKPTIDFLLRTELEMLDELANEIHEMQWVLLEPQEGEGEFVTSDSTVAMYDDNPKFPWSGNGWKSSGRAETTMPLTPHHCLLLMPGPPSLGVAQVDRPGVRRINLRTYGWATRYIYGTSQAVITKVRMQAKQYPELVARPRRGCGVILEEVDPADPTVGIEHDKRGWPRTIAYRNDDGTERCMGYTVLDPDDPAAMQAALNGTNAGVRGG